MSSRVGIDGTEWAPRTGAEWKIGQEHRVRRHRHVQGLSTASAPNSLPSVVVWSDDSRLLPRYSYSFGIVSGDEAANTSPPSARVSAADAPLRMVFTDGFEQFWDGLYIDAGDIRRDVRVGVPQRARQAASLVDVSSTAGTATPRHGHAAEPREDLRRPATWSRRSSRRARRWPSPTARSSSRSRAGIDADYRTERVDVRMAQSLHLPLDLKLLLGVELARAENSPHPARHARAGRRDAEVHRRRWQ